MPRGRRGEKRPADVIGNAVHVMKIATGEIEERLESEPGTDAALTPAQMGKRGGKARAEKLTQEQRVAIARQAARKRWGQK
jgi:hypothetical protein